MLDIEVKIKRGSLTFKPSHDDQLHLDADADLVPQLRGSSVVIDGERISGAIHATVFVPVPSHSLDANLGRGPCEITGLDLASADVNLGLGDLSLSQCSGKWDINVGKGDAAVYGLSGTLDINVGMGRLKMAEVSGSADINDGLGAISAERCQGKFDLNAGKGDVTWENAQGGSLAANAGLGSIHVRGGGGDELEINAGLGKVVVDGDWNDAKIETGLGDITVSGRFGELAASAKRSGNIAVSLPADIGSRIEASTDRGRIVSHLNLIEVGHAGPQRGQRLVGVVGDGSGQVTVHTRRGDVVLAQYDRENPPSSPPPDFGAEEQRITILQQLKDGALTVDEAEALLEALE